jgi:hypothetical protein
MALSPKAIFSISWISIAVFTECETSCKCVVLSNQTIEKQYRGLWVQNSLDSENSEPIATSGRKLCSLLFLVLAVSLWTSRYVSLGTFRYILVLAQKFRTHFRSINSTRIYGLACIITSMAVNLLTSKLWRNPHWEKLFSRTCLGSLALPGCSSSCQKNILDTFQFCWCPSMAKRLIFVTCLVENVEKCSLLSIYTEWNNKHFRVISDLSLYWFASVYLTDNQREVELQHFIH